MASKREARVERGSTATVPISAKRLASAGGVAHMNHVWNAPREEVSAGYLESSRDREELFQYFMYILHARCTKGCRLHHGNT